MRTLPEDVVFGLRLDAGPSGGEYMRMPGVLSRYVAIEILKTMLLCAGVLVAVIGFGAAIKPLAQNLIGGSDVLKYILVASVPMLQYALPFAAGFAATLVVHRLATDNELLAMSVSGLSYRQIMAPVFWIGGALFIFMLVLVNYGVPYFWAKMEGMLTRDVTRLLASSIERGEAFSLGKTQIFADDVMLIADPKESDAESRLVLLGVAALETGAAEKSKTEFTSEYATLDVYRVDGRAILKLALGDSTIYREGDDALVRVPSAEPRAMDLGRGFNRDPKSFSLNELLFYRAESRGYPDVERRRVDVYAKLSEVEAWECMQGGIQENGSLVLSDVRRGFDYRIAAERISPEGLSGGVMVEEIRDGVILRRALGPDAELIYMDGEPGSSPRFDFIFTPKTVHDLQEPDAPSIRWPGRLARLELNTCAISDESVLGNDDLLGRIDSVSVAAKEFDEPLANELVLAGSSVQAAMDSLRWDIDARIQQRIAQSLLAPLLLLLGSVLAVVLKHTQPLYIYLLAFLPSIVSILLISTGEQTLRSGPGFKGQLLLWLGLGIIVVAICAAWSRLRRN